MNVTTGLRYENKTVMAGLKEQDRQNVTAKTGQATQDRQNRICKTRKADWIGRTGQAEQDS
jgi:hypothetical protein